MTVKVQRVLVRIPNWVGDVVMATPALKAIREAWPSAFVVAAGRSYVTPLLEGSPLVDDLLSFQMAEERVFGGGMKLARRYRRQQFDAAILLTNSFTSALPTFLARIPIRVGLSGDGRAPLLTHRVQPILNEAGERKPIPMPTFYQRILDVLEISEAGPHYILPATAEDESEAGAFWEEFRLGNQGPVIGINPGARFGSSKLWQPERFGALSRRLREDGYCPLLLEGPGEEALAERIREVAGDSLVHPERILPLPTLRGVMPRLAGLVTNDTGPRHIAVAAGVPTVVLMGPTWPEWTAWNLERTVVLRHDVPCGPCHLKICPTDHACMELIEVEEALTAIKTLIPDPAG